MYDVRTANTGKDGIATAREFHPHVVLLDIVLPDIGGGEVCVALGDTPIGLSYGIGPFRAVTLPVAPCCRSL